MKSILGICALSASIMMAGCSKPVDETTIAHSINAVLKGMETPAHPKKVVRPSTGNHSNVMFQAKPAGTNVYVSKNFQGTVSVIMSLNGGESTVLTENGRCIQVAPSANGCDWLSPKEWADIHATSVRYAIRNGAPI